MNNLASSKCIPCEVGTPPLQRDKIDELKQQISASWQIIDNKKIMREFKFADFKEAITFVNKVADLAENEGHHPDIEIHYNKVILTLWTHKIGGLSDNDFILAAKIDNL